MDLNRRIAASVEKLAAELIALRRKLHEHPELAFEEHETAKVVAAFLARLGVPHRTGVGKTGIVALIDGGKPGPTVHPRRHGRAADQRADGAAVRVEGPG